MYGIVITAAQPVEVYDAMHAELARRVGTAVDGLLFHLGRATSGGFQVLEIWESKEHYDRCTVELLVPLMMELAGGVPPDAEGQLVEEFEVRGLVIPRGDILV